MALKRHHYPRNEASVKAEGGPAPARTAPSSVEAAAASELGSSGTAAPPGTADAARSPHSSLRGATMAKSEREEPSPATLQSAPAALDMNGMSPSSSLPSEPRVLAQEAAHLTFRLLNYKDIREVRSFLTLIHAIGAEADPYYFEKTPELIDRAVIKARREENPSNTFAGLALDRGAMVAVHVLRRFEEGPLVGAQVSGLWVAPLFRRRGVARRLKEMGEAWARSIGAHFLNSNVLSQNAPMLALNRELGFENYRINLRKRL